MVSTDSSISSYYPAKFYYPVRFLEVPCSKPRLLALYEIPPDWAKSLVTLFRGDLFKGYPVGFVDVRNHLQVLLSLVLIIEFVGFAIILGLVFRIQFALIDHLDFWDLLFNKPLSLWDEHSQHLSPKHIKPTPHFLLIVNCIGPRVGQSGFQGRECFSSFPRVDYAGRPLP
jgi:hypothetical protein